MTEDQPSPPDEPTSSDSTTDNTTSSSTSLNEIRSLYERYFAGEITYQQLREECGEVDPEHAFDENAQAGEGSAEEEE
jgi:hypothetical protein